MQRHVSELSWWKIIGGKKINCFIESFLAHSQTVRQVYGETIPSLSILMEKTTPDEQQHFIEMRLQMGMLWQHSKMSHRHLLSLEEQEVLKQLKQKLVNFYQPGVRREEGQKGIGISIPCCFVGEWWSQEIDNLLILLQWKWEKRFTHLFPCCDIVLIFLQVSCPHCGWRMQQLLPLFTHTWRAEERGQLLWITIPLRGKGSNPKSSSAAGSSHLKIPKEFHLCISETKRGGLLWKGRGNVDSLAFPMKRDGQLHVASF